jgi:methionine sulfoxide reductase catalytic subunit
MSSIIIPPGWNDDERGVTDRDAYHARRSFIRKLGLGSIGAAILGGATAFSLEDSARQPLVRGPLDTIPLNAPREGYPAKKNTSFRVPERPVTDRIASASYNNFYEFINQGDLKRVWPLTDDYEPFPMTIQVKGRVEKKFRIDVSDLIRKMDLEERIYRFRCVEAWSMTIPWTGFPLRKLIELCRPTSKATHVRFVSAKKPGQMPGIRAAPWLDFPYYEALRLDEAMNDLAFVATGMYGEPLPRQSGSPLRLTLPWKYGYKGPKAIVEIEFTDKQPPTFWNDLYSNEYGFLSNVNPNIPHPRWSQAHERFISRINGEQDRPTQLFNGYEAWVGDLYPDEPTSLTRTVR